MWTALEAVERALPALLADEAAWQSLDIDYHPPRVERLWRAWGDHRVCLHRIHPCAPEEALFHPHPWPSAMRILQGVYEMDVGWGPGTHPPAVAARLRLGPGSTYEMTDPDGWHRVRPIGGVSQSVMVTGAPWSRVAPRSAGPLAPLTKEQAHELWKEFCALLLG
jgi:hypothetical protein